MQKILEHKNEDWSKGISAQGHMPIGGLFQGMGGIDPFYNQGLVVPSFTPDSITPSSTPKFLTNFNSSGTAYLYWHSNTEIKQILRDSPYTQTDRSSNITFGGLDVIGAIQWKGYYVYARAGGDLRARAIPITTGTDTQIKAGFNSTQDYMALCVGADGNLYHGDNSLVGIITSPTGTTGNSNTFVIDSDFTVRDLINDGQYLVILADNNTQTTAGRQVGNYRCRVYFWDMIKSTADVIYDVQDSYLIAGKQLDGNIYFFGYNGLYVCNTATSPKMVRPFTGYNGISVGKPSNPYQLTKSKGSIYWIDGFNSSLTNGRVFAYGNPTTGSTKIFYEPHLNGNSSNAQTFLQVVGDTFWMGEASPKIYVQNTGSTAGTGTITTIDKTMDRPHRFEMVKVVLARPLSSGQSVACSVVSADGSKTISNNETKSYSAGNPKQILNFKRNPTTNSLDRFEDVRITLTIVGATVQRMSVYATPLDDSAEDL